MTARVTVLINDEARKGSVAEHGFSVWIEVGGHRILFDTGQGGALLPNAQRLGVNLADATELVLSHGHYDHTGGLAAALEKAGPEVAVYCHADVVKPRYGLERQTPKAVGMPQTYLAALQGLEAKQLRWITGVELLSEAVGVTGPIPRETDYEDAGGALFLDPEGHFPDPFLDDQALWIPTSRGLVIVVGCAHAGVINTLMYVRHLTGESRIRAVIGGFHLLHASRHRLERTLEALRLLAPKAIFPCHCTGSEAMRLLQDTFGTAASRGFAGREFEFSDM